MFDILAYPAYNSLILYLAKYTKYIHPDKEALRTMSLSTTIGAITKCQICSHKNLITILNLGHHPPVHGHIVPEKLHEPEIAYPLHVCFCDNCGLVQLNYAVDPKILFAPEYPYFTGVTNMLVNNFQVLAASVTEKYQLSPQDLVIDIGSNDGTLLKAFQAKGTKVLGVEPTNVARVAMWNGVPTIQEFFNEAIAMRIVSEHGRAKIVTSTNVFAHIFDLFGVLRGIDTLLDQDGVFVSESQYLLDIITTLEVDTIYHEHLRFYSLKPLMKLFSLSGFSVVDAERIASAGGSIRVYAEKGIKPASERVQAMIAEEEAAGLYDIPTLKKFAEKTIETKQRLLALLLDCKKDGKRIVGIGAPGRSNTLLNFAHIDSQLIDYAVEKEGSPKIGLLSPGMHIPIVSEERLYTDQPEYGLILSWHIGAELMKKLRAGGYRGTFIIPLPNPHMVTDF